MKLMEFGRSDGLVMSRFFLPGLLVAFLQWAAAAALERIGLSVVTGLTMLLFSAFLADMLVLQLFDYLRPDPLGEAGFVIRHTLATPALITLVINAAAYTLLDRKLRDKGR